MHPPLLKKTESIFGPGDFNPMFSSSLPKHTTCLDSATLVSPCDSIAERGFSSAFPPYYQQDVRVIFLKK